MSRLISRTRLRKLRTCACLISAKHTSLDIRTYTNQRLAVYVAHMWLHRGFLPSSDDETRVSRFWRIANRFFIFRQRSRFVLFPFAPLKYVKRTIVARQLNCSPSPSLRSRKFKEISDAFSFRRASWWEMRTHDMLNDMFAIENYRENSLKERRSIFASIRAAKRLFLIERYSCQVRS